MPPALRQGTLCHRDKGGRSDFTLVPQIQAGTGAGNHVALPLPSAGYAGLVFRPLIMCNV